MTIFLTSQNFTSNLDMESTNTNEDSLSNNISPLTSIIHDPIFIDGDDGVKNWTAFPDKTGSGTFGDPYVIQNFEINAGGAVSGIYIRDSDVYVEIVECSCILSTSILEAGIRLFNCSNIKIINCTSQNNEQGIMLEGISHNNTLSGNIVRYNDYEGIILYSSANNTISENIVSYNTGDGIDLETSSGNSLFGNTANNNGYVGFFLSSSDNNTLSGNTAISNHRDGFLLQSSDNNTILDNTVNYNTDYGIRQITSSYNILIGNLASYNTHYGIFLSGSNYITLSNNTASNNVVGFCLSSSDNNILSENNASFNTQDGIYLYSSSGNTLFGNTFSENSINEVKIESDSVNSWDNGTYGNYWGDYQEKCPTATNNLTIWDTPYQINVDNIDNFPLVTLDASEGENVNPTISHPIDRNFTRESSGNNLEWTISDKTILDPTYIIYQDGTEIETGPWVPWNPISINMDALPRGVYNLSISFMDGFGGIISDSVNVTVLYELELGLDDHAPISINGNTALATFPTKTGSGTFADPYIIENIFIDADLTGSGIYLQNVDVFLHIINCTIIYSGSNSGDAGIRLENCHNITIINCTSVDNGFYGIFLFSSSNNTLYGNNASYNSEYGIYLVSSTNNTLSENNASFNSDVGLYLESSSINILSKNNVSHNSYFGIKLVTSSNNTLSRNDVNHNYWGGIVLESASTNNIISENNVSNSISGIYSHSSTNNTISMNNANYNTNFNIWLHSSHNNTIFGNNASFSEYDDGISLINSKDNTLFENNASYNFDNGIYLESSDNNMVSENIANNNSEYGIWLESSSDNNIISGNTANINLNGIQLSSSSYNTISANDASFNAQSGIKLESSSNNNILSGNVINNNIQYGIYLQELSEFNTLSGNDINNNNDGIWLDLSSNNNNFSENTISYSNNNGINIFEGSNNNFIGNTISYSSNYGIYIMEGSNNNFFGNTISYNDNYGIYIDWGSAMDNNIWGNIIIGNLDYQALDNSLSNNWDNGTHGNYWDDFQGRYTSAIANGLCWDTSYEINGDAESFDNFPLVFSPIPESPTLITIDQTISVDHITLQWNEIQGVEFYRIFVDGVPTITTEATSYNMLFPINGTYEITVSAISWYCESDPSSSLFIEVGIILYAPSAPGLITGSQTITSNNIIIEWYLVEGATSYRIYVNGSFNETTSSTSQQIWLNTNGDYIITVTALNSSGESGHSVAITIIVDIPPINAGDDTTDEPTDDATDDTGSEIDPWYAKPWVWSAIGASTTVVFGGIGILKKVKKKPGDIIKSIVNKLRKK